MFLTIITPTYNRAKELNKLYDSLCRQTCGDFKWLIVDDGSTDETTGVVKGFQNSSSFPIDYVYKQNGGKHTALNLGISQIDSPLTFIVDSDDYLTEDAVENIKKIYEKYNNNSAICGYSFLRAFPDGKVNGKLFSENELIGSYIDTRINCDDTCADKAEVYLTRCLQEFPFPEYENERFLSEDLVWIRISRKYKMVHINKVIYIGNYLEGGLTNNRRQHNIKSPLGCMNRAIEFMQHDIKFKYRIKGCLQYIIYGKFAHISLIKIIKNATDKWLVFFLLIPGLIIYNIWRCNKKNNN